MSRTVAELLDEALSLSEPARAELAELIAVSLATTPRESRAAWATEIRLRAATIGPGQVESSPWDYVRRDLHSILSRKKALSGQVERSNGSIANGSPDASSSFGPSPIDSMGRMGPITDEERQAQRAMRRASLEAAWDIHGDEDEHVTDEMWDEIMRNLGVDPTIVREFKP